MARRTWGVALVIVLGGQWPSGGRAGPVTRAQLDDPPPGVAATASCCEYVAATGLHAGTVTVRNGTANATDERLVVVLKGLPAGVTGANGDGVLDGEPYWLVSRALPPGAATKVDVTLRGPAGSRPKAAPTVHRLVSGAVNARALRALSRPFTLAVLPDTQKYVTADDRPGLTRQVQWVLANRAARNLAFVTQLGDVVDHSTVEAEWRRATRALAPLVSQETLPFSIVRGNHDHPGPFMAHFPLDVMRSKPWFVEAEPKGVSQAQVFRVDGACFLHVGLEDAPDPDALAWADRLLARPELQGLPVIVSTHDYLEETGLSPNGRRIWEGLVKTHPAVFMVLSGHVHPGEYAAVGVDDAGLPVFQLRSDYQERDHGGDGWMRLVTVDPGRSRILVETYSPVLGRYERDADSELEYEVDLRQRLTARGAAPRRAPGRGRPATPAAPRSTGPRPAPTPRSRSAPRRARGR